MRTEKKMFASLPPSCLPELRRGAFARLFGQNIRSVREGKGLSIEQAACLSGMEVSEWAAIEEGYVPQDINRLRGHGRRRGDPLGPDRHVGPALQGCVGALIGRPLALRTHNRISSLPRGGEEDQDKGNIGSQESKYQYPNRASQLVQGRSRSTGSGDDGSADGVHRKLRCQARIHHTTEEGAARMKRARLEGQHIGRQPL